MRTSLRLGTIALGAMLANGAALAQASGEAAVLVVVGRGVFETAPDNATFSASILSRGTNASEALASHQPRVARGRAFLEQMQSSGLRIRESQFSLGQIRRPPSLANKPSTSSDAAEFVAQTSFAVSCDGVGHINDIVSRLAGTGLFDIQRVGFDTKDRKGGMNEARRLAVGDARDQAGVYADAAHVRLLDVARIADGEASFAESGNNADLPARSPNVQIIPPATVQFSAVVTMTWRIAASP